MQDGIGVPGARPLQHEDSVDETLQAIVQAAVGTVPFEVRALIQRAIGVVMATERCTASPKTGCTAAVLSQSSSFYSG
jgi:hypothetical protein